MSTYVFRTLSRNDSDQLGCDVGQVISVDMLSDDVLLDVFHFFVDEAGREYESDSEKDSMKAWQSLVHVCRRWRIVVFGSPRRLNLRLVCGFSTRARDTVNIWPALPLLIQDYSLTGDVDNIVALLERSDVVPRICQIDLLQVFGLELEDILETMQVSFPELTHLILFHNGQMALPLSDLFLGGSAPRLRILQLDQIPYPGLPKLLLSATHLTRLDYTNVPDSGYIPPEAMVACLSTLTSLEQLCLIFRFPRPLSNQESHGRPPSIRTSLPVLDNFMFVGSSEYLEVLVAPIDAPRLRELDIRFFSDIVFVTPQFTRFITRTPVLEASDTAEVDVLDDTASVELSSAYARLNVSISCRELDWQLSFLEQVCTPFLPTLSTLEVLHMKSRRPWPQDWKDNIDYAQWLELLHSFSTVKHLYLSKEFAPCVAAALQELIGGRTIEVFPTLENIFLEELQESGPVQEGIGKFVAARQVTSHPVTVSRWDRYSN